MGDVGKGVTPTAIPLENSIVLVPLLNNLNDVKKEILFSE
jgi:hypothetical protein